MPDDLPPRAGADSSDFEAFEAAARRTLQQRIHYSFIRTFKPVLDEAPYRSFDSMAEYRKWCAESLPSWLGYGPAEQRPEDGDRSF